jgi:hypothetical protein
MILAESRRGLENLVVSCRPLIGRRPFIVLFSHEAGNILFQTPRDAQRSLGVAEAAELMTARILEQNNVSPMTGNTLAHGLAARGVRDA